jgi:hypothetical protein
MNAKVLTAAALLAAIATPASAQFWIVRGGQIGSGRCVVVDKEPTDAAIIIAGGNHRFYSTRIEAERDAQMVCRLFKA